MHSSCLLLCRLVAVLCGQVRLKGNIVKITDVSKIPISDSNAVKDIAEKAGVNVKDCYQCGKCSAGCPMTQGMDVPPHKIIRFMQLDLLDEVLKSKTPWICASCNVCSARCPQNVDIANVMREARKASKAAGYQPFPDSDKFEEAFLANVRRFGRSHEAILAAQYNLTTGHLFQDVPNVPAMLSRGMISMKISKVKDQESVRKIMKKTEKGAE